MIDLLPVCDSKCSPVRCSVIVGATLRRRTPVTWTVEEGRLCCWHGAGQPDTCGRVSGDKQAPGPSQTFQNIRSSFSDRLLLMSCSNRLRRSCLPKAMRLYHTSRTLDPVDGSWTYSTYSFFLATIFDCAVAFWALHDTCFPNLI